MYPKISPIIGPKTDNLKKYKVTPPAENCYPFIIYNTTSNKTIAVPSLSKDSPSINVDKL